MSDIVTTLHPENDANTNLYPNIVKDNIPEGSIDVSKLDSNIINLLNNIGELHPSGVDTSEHILAKTSDTGIWIGSDTGKWYYWNGTTYTVGGDYIENSIDAIYHNGNQLKDNNDENIIPVIDISDVGTNLFNKYRCDVVGYYAYNSGIYNSSATTYRSLKYVKVKPSTQYIFNKTWAHISYWLDNAYVGGVTSESSSSFTFTTPASIDYLIISINQNQIDSCMLIEGNTLPSAYVPYKETLKSYFKINNDNIDNDIIKLNNLNDDVKNYLMDRIIPTMEIGNIAMGSTQWYYTDSTTRVRTPQNYFISLDIGDVIKLTDYSNARMYIGWKIGNKLYNSGAWLTSDFTVSAKGEYVILVSNIVEQTISDITDLTNLIRVYQYHYFKNTILENKNNVFIDMINRTSNVKSVNHRGYSIGAPENTLPAYKLSKQKGFDYVECDVAFTLDKVPVLLHDETIDRTSNGTGYIDQLTYEYVRTLDFGSWFNPIYAGTKIPSFEEFIVLCKRLGLKPYVEIKNNNNYTQTDIKILTDIVIKNGMVDNVSWISFSIECLEYVHNLLPKARLGYVLYEITETNMQEILALKDDNEIFIDEYYIHLTEEIINSLIDNDIPLEVYIIDSESVLFSQSNYISGITSNSLNAGVSYYNKAMNE